MLAYVGPKEAFRIGTAADVDLPVPGVGSLALVDRGLVVRRPAPEETHATLTIGFP